MSAFLVQTDDSRDQEGERQSIIRLICSSSSISPLIEQGVYLFGKTGNNRAVCLVSRESNGGCLTRDCVASMVREIRQAGLRVPFLCFGYSKAYHEPDLFTFVQIPFERPDNPVPRVIRAMNLQGRPRLLQIR